jgi:hypothetical protein
MTLRRSRAEPDIYRGIRVHDNALFLAADTGELSLIYVGFIPTGVFQHAISSVPNFSEGYCTGDNARAFILAVLMGELGDDAELERSLAGTSAAFLH